MAISRRIARPLLASIFVAGGIDAVRNPTEKVKQAESVTGPLAERIGFLPNDPEKLVRINGAVQIGAGVLLATGRFPRLASVALIGSIVPTTYAGHRFWEEADEEARTQQLVHFLKNLGLLGGLILAAVDTEGEPSLGWRTKRRAHQIEAAVALGRAASDARARGLSDAAHAKAARAAKASERAARKGSAATRRATRRANRTGVDSALKTAAAGAAVARSLNATGLEGVRQARELVADARNSGAGAHVAHQVVSAVGHAARELEPQAHSLVTSGLELVGPYLASGAQHTTDLLGKVEERLPAH